MQQPDQLLESLKARGYQVQLPGEQTSYADIYFGTDVTAKRPVSVQIYVVSDYRQERYSTFREVLKKHRQLNIHDIKIFKEKIEDRDVVIIVDYELNQPGIYTHLHHSDIKYNISGLFKLLQPVTDFMCEAHHIGFSCGDISLENLCVRKYQGKHFIYFNKMHTALYLADLQNDHNVLDKAKDVRQLAEIYKVVFQKEMPAHNPFIVALNRIIATPGVSIYQLRDTIRIYRTQRAARYFINVLLFMTVFASLLSAPLETFASFQPFVVGVLVLFGTVKFMRDRSVSYFENNHLTYRQFILWCTRAISFSILMGVTAYIIQLGAMQPAQDIEMTRIAAATQMQGQIGDLQASHSTMTVAIGTQEGVSSAREAARQIEATGNAEYVGTMNVMYSSITTRLPGTPDDFLVTQAAEIPGLMTREAERNETLTFINHALDDTEATTDAIIATSSSEISTLFAPSGSIIPVQVQGVVLNNNLVIVSPESTATFTPEATRIAVVSTVIPTIAPSLTTPLMTTLLPVTTIPDITPVTTIPIDTPIITDTSEPASPTPSETPTTATDDPLQRIQPQPSSEPTATPLPGIGGEDVIPTAEGVEPVIITATPPEPLILNPDITVPAEIFSNAPLPTSTPEPAQILTTTPEPTSTPEPTQTFTITPVPTDTATSTPEPTATFTATTVPTSTSTLTPRPTFTPLPTATPTRQPRSIDIYNFQFNPLPIIDINYTAFEAQILPDHPPNIFLMFEIYIGSAGNCNAGVITPGIRALQPEFRNDERQSKYCAFGGDAACLPMNQGDTGPVSLPNGDYILRAYAPDDPTIIEDCQAFTLALP